LSQARCRGVLTETDVNDETQIVALPADLAVAAAEDCRQSLLTALSEAEGPVRVVFEGEGKVSLVAAQLALAAAAAARAAGRPAEFGEETRTLLAQLGWEG